MEILGAFCSPQHATGKNHGAIISFGVSGLHFYRCISLQNYVEDRPATRLRNSYLE